MYLRSGKVYDSEYPLFLKEFSNYSNPYFCIIWDNAAKLYNNYIEKDITNSKIHKEGYKFFRKYIHTEIYKLYILGFKNKSFPCECGHNH